MNTLLDYIPDTKHHSGDQYVAPHCPKCGRGEDRLCIWPDDRDGIGRVWCRRCDWGARHHMDGTVDGIEYLREVEDMSFHEACEALGAEHKIDQAPRGDTAPQKPSRPTPTQSRTSSTKEQWRPYEPPNETWRQAAAQFAKACKDRLWSDTRAARSAREYLHGRGFTDDTIDAAGLGLNPADQWPLRTDWGLDPKDEKPEGGKLWLPRGVVIPWADDEGVSSVNIRRPNGDVDPDGQHWEARKYWRAAGPSAPLYNAERVDGETPVVLVEGEFDALAVSQAACDLCTPVATGSTGGARRKEWRDLLAGAPTVLVSFDAEDAGEDASQAWLDALPNAIRWVPHANDAADMLAQGMDVRMWARCGIQGAAIAR